MAVLDLASSVLTGVHTPDFRSNARCCAFALAVGGSNACLEAAGLCRFWALAAMDCVGAGVRRNKKTRWGSGLPNGLCDRGEARVNLVVSHFTGDYLWFSAAGKRQAALRVAFHEVVECQLPQMVGQSGDRKAISFPPPHDLLLAHAIAEVTLYRHAGEGYVIEPFEEFGDQIVDARQLQIGFLILSHLNTQRL
jgi:hypothetical protein